MTVLLFSLLLGLCWRAGGGLIDFKGNGIVFRCILPSLILGSFFGLTWYLYIALIPAFYLGEMVGYSKHWLLGRPPSKYTFWQDFTFLTLRGVWFTLLAGLVVGYGTSWYYGLIVALAGSVMGIAYELGWRSPSIGKEFNQGPEISEFYYMILTGLIALGGSSIVQLW